MKYFIAILLFAFFSCKKDPTIVELTIVDQYFIPADSAMVIFTGEAYDSSYTNEIIFNDTFYTDSEGKLTVDFSDRQTNGQTGFVSALIKIQHQLKYKEVNLKIYQFQTTTKEIILQ